jgi:hypothetical protein
LTKWEPAEPIELDGVFAALQHKPLYEGTVPEHVKAKRRARNKQARASRKANRK